MKWHLRSGIYTSLIAIAEQAGAGKEIKEFQQSLREEEAMAQTVADLIIPTTAKYLKLTLSGKQADR